MGYAARNRKPEPAEIVISLVQDKETRNTIRYQEVSASGPWDDKALEKIKEIQDTYPSDVLPTQAPIFGSVYMSKHTFGGPMPKRILLTLSMDQDELERLLKESKK